MPFSFGRCPFGPPTAVVVHDYETTGLDHVHDQVVQAAALRTTLAFEPPSDTFTARCRRLPHVTPSPTAMLRTRMTPRDLEVAPHSAHGLMNALQERFATWGPALFIGHNSIRFDERILRHNLFATLHHPYLTQLDGNMRADSMVMARTVAVLAPDAIAVPQGPTGMSSFALGPLCRANGIDLAEGAAHDAMADAHATLALLGLLRDRAPDAVAASLMCADKRHILDLVRRESILFVLRWRAGAPLVQAVAPLGAKPGDKNAIVVADLAVDPADYASLSDDDLDAFLAANPDTVRVVKANGFPQIFAPHGPMVDVDRLRAVMRRENAQGGSTACALRDLSERANRIQNDPTLHARLYLALDRRRPPRPSDPTPEERLYERFSAPGDYAAARDMHEAPSWDRAKYVWRFADDRMTSLAARWVYQCDGSALDADLRDAMAVERRRRLLGPADARWRTIAAARAELDTLAGTTPAEDGLRLAQIAAYLDRIETDARAIV